MGILYRTWIMQLSDISVARVYGSGRIIVSKQGFIFSSIDIFTPRAVRFYLPADVTVGSGPSLAAPGQMSKPCRRLEYPYASS